MRHTFAYVMLSSFVSLTLSGCFLYFGGDDDDCLFGGGAGETAGAPAPGIRNPFTGQCEFFGGGPFPCDDRCGPCPAPAEAPAGAPSSDPIPGGAAMPSWGFCESQCSVLFEGACLATEGCRGIYDPEGRYSECWSVDLTGPIQGGVCDGLDAWECSRHDDCVAIHESLCPDPSNADRPGFSCGAGNFLRCQSEGPTSPGDCFSNVTCNLPPPGCPPNSVPGRANGCWTGTCILVEDCEPTMPGLCSEITNEGACVNRADCTPLYQGVDCQCSATGCQCAGLAFQACS